MTRLHVFPLLFARCCCLFYWWQWRIGWHSRCCIVSTLFCVGKLRQRESRSKTEKEIVFSLFIWFSSFADKSCHFVCRIRIVRTYTWNVLLVLDMCWLWACIRSMCQDVFNLMDRLCVRWSPHFTALYRLFWKSIIIRYSALTFYLNRRTELTLTAVNNEYHRRSGPPIWACTQYDGILNMTNYNVKSHWSSPIYSTCTHTHTDSLAQI